jgi:septal ring factor EnvC (AmiA/AmiB activator)
MSRYDDEYESPDESEDTDPIIRELRAEIIRLEAQLDQLQASVRERAEEATEIRAKLAELELALDRLKARRRRDEKLLILAWLMVVISLVMSLYTYFTT